MVFAKLLSRGAKSGYTLVEVLVVVIIMGVLSTMGVAGLQRAVANARIKDAAINTAAFVESVANLSTQRSEKLCLGVADCLSDGNPKKCRTLIVVAAAPDPTSSHINCNSTKPGIIDRFSLDAPSVFISGGSGCPTDMLSWLSTGSSVNPNAMFEPRLGLSAMPPEGMVCIKYGDSDVYGAVRKTKVLNRVVPMWKVGDDATQNGNWSNWTEL